MRILLALIGAALLIAAAQAPAPHRLAVVDLDKIFDGSPDKARLEQQLASTKEELEARLAQIDAQIAELKAELALLEKGTTRYDELELQGLALQQKKAREQHRVADEFARRKGEFHDKILSRIQEVIAEVAREGHYSAVFQREFTVSQESLSWQAVLYCAPEVDLTQTVLDRLRGGQ